MDKEGRMTYTDSINRRRRCVMSTAEAKRRAKKKFIAEKLEGITFRVPVGQESRIQEHAKSQGESTNAFIYRAVNEAIERDGEKAKTED